MLLIGNKPYEKLNLNNIIDTFDENIRHNFGFPNNNNGTKTYIQYMNCHVYENLFKKKNINCYINEYNQPYFNNFIKSFDTNNFVKIIRQNMNNKNNANNYLKNKNCPYVFNKLLRIGCETIFFCLYNKINPIFLSNYSLVYNTKNIIHLYNKNNTISDCHDGKNEIDIIIWLHNNNYIDATFCALIDCEIPSIDCNVINPTIKALKIILQYFDHCILINNKSIKDINKYKKYFILCSDDNNICLYKK